MTVVFRSSIPVLLLLLRDKHTWITSFSETGFRNIDFESRFGVKSKNDLSHSGTFSNTFGPILTKKELKRFAISLESL